jgi:hyperosmotically inducible periplasmic protein
MVSKTQALYIGIGSVVLLCALAGHAPSEAQTVATDETVRSVRRMLERLPYYGVFDFLVFRIDRGTVYLAGYSFEGRLKSDAEAAAKRAPGVDEVANKIELLPASPNDDRIRWETFYRIYADDFLSRYAPGGRLGVLQDLRDERHFQVCNPSASIRSTSS